MAWVRFVSTGKKGIERKGKKAITNLVIRCITPFTPPPINTSL
jgi:hypothetical protein